MNSIAWDNHACLPLDPSDEHVFDQDELKIGLGYRGDEVDKILALNCLRIVREVWKR